jgi:hypothetical protein
LLLLEQQTQVAVAVAVVRTQQEKQAGQVS